MQPSRLGPKTRGWFRVLLVAIFSSAVASNGGADCLPYSQGQQQTTGGSGPSAGGLQSPGPGNRVLLINQAPANRSAANFKQSARQPFKDLSDKLSISVKENTPIGTKLVDIAPREDDLMAGHYHLHGGSGSSGGGSNSVGGVGSLGGSLAGGQPNNQIVAIVGGEDQRAFSLRVDNVTNKVELINEVLFDYESNKRLYNVIIRSASLYFRYEVEVDIAVSDENDNKPQLEDFAIVFNNYKNNFPTKPIGRVPASDLDIDDVLHYSVLSGNNARLIVVNSTNGDIQLSPWLDSNVPLPRAVMEVAVSDGQNEAVAKLVLTVNLITETMLHNSVTLRFESIGRDEFLTKKYDLFLTQMARILGSNSMYGTNNIVLFDVDESPTPQETTAAATNYQLQYRLYQPAASVYGLNIGNNNNNGTSQTLSSAQTQTGQVGVSVSFSARADGNDVEAYLTSQYIEERVYLHRAQISQNLELYLAPIQDNLCATEPCENYQECQATYTFDKAPKVFYTSTSMIFRPIKASASFACLCPATFTGMRHKNECNLQINQCFSNPCLNGGLCHRHESGFSCECKADFLGPRCEHSFANSTCQSISRQASSSSSSSQAPAATVTSGVAHQSIAQQVSSALSSQQVVDDLLSGSMGGKQQAGAMCSGKSRCVNLYRSANHIGKPAGSTGGFTCQGCPFGSQWATDLCQLRARSFDRDSYLTLPALKRRHKFHLQLQFATVQSDATLLYNGRYNEKRDFIALEIIDSHLRFTYSLGSEKQAPRSITLSALPVSNGEWHKVAIDYRDHRNVTLILDDCDPIIDEALARHQPSARRCSNSTSSMATTTGGGGDSMISADEDNKYRMLDLTSPLIVGSRPASMPNFQLSSLATAAASFTGCISDLYLDHQLVDLSVAPISEYNTQPGCQEKRTFCQQHSCNGLPCQDAYGAAKCVCGEERLGKSCEIYLSNEKVRKFNGNSYLTFQPIESSVPAQWLVALHFRTLQPNGILFKILLDSEASVTLELSEGALKLTYRGRALTLNRLPFDDGEWHHAEISWNADLVSLQADYNPNLSSQSSEMGNIQGAVMRSVIVGAWSSRSLSAPSLASDSLSAASAAAAAVAPNPESSAAAVATAESGGGSASNLLLATASTLAPGDDFANGIFVYNSTTGTTSTTAAGSSQQSFVGCIYGLNISDNSEWWISPSEERNVERGCPVVDVCETSPCPPNSRCVRRGLNQRKCLCNPGFVGDACVPVCDLAPCQGENSRCIPASATQQQASPIEGSTATAISTHTTGGSNQLLISDSTGGSGGQSQSQYTCECEPHRSGKNCEHQLSARCPSNWWGKPVVVAHSTGEGNATITSNSSICGPCNCDESRGFDGDCDKTSGQCFCKPSHYQPPGADYCLACDCYLVGSLGSVCNQTSGQCKCRPGVVGRRCDTCASPYAEVTLRGCEVIYDACPKTYSDGIWWDKTALGRKASQQCPPSTSTGTATRLCHRTDNWQRANLFDCVSNTFTDLLNQFKFLEDNKYSMTTNSAIKIAANLRTALNETISNPTLQLYGSDMFISFRLIHHLIQHESQERGLNLTHKQDRMFIRNLVESISYLLEPAYADNWPEIAARSPNGGAEHLLRLMDTYGRVLIESQSDTFTPPFEVSAKHFTFGMDTLATDQLWDLSKWSLTSGGGGAANSLAIGGGGGSHFPSSPPYATDPFEPALPLLPLSQQQQPPVSVASSSFANQRHHHHHLSYNNHFRNAYQQGTTTTSELTGSHFNGAGQSPFLDFGGGSKDLASPSVVIPKYDNYPNTAGSQIEQTTKALVPLRVLNVKTPQELLPATSLYAQARSRAKRNNNDYIAGDETVTHRGQQVASVGARARPALVVFAIYRSLGPLLPNEHDNSVQDRMGMMAAPNAPVVWLTMRPANSSDFVASKNIQPKITYTLKIAEPVSKTRPQCATWDFVAPTTTTHQSHQTQTQTSTGGVRFNETATTGDHNNKLITTTGRFTTRGCELRGVQANNKLRHKYEYVNCSCDHLGAVTVLMDNAVSFDYLAADDETNLRDSTLIGALSISICLLLATLFVLSCIRGHSIKSNSNSINKNLIFILALIESLILYTLISRQSLIQREYQCKLVAIFLHYFSIALFFWLLVNAIHFYRMHTELRDINHGPMRFYHVLGYAIPAFFVSVAVGLRIEQFGNYLFCWLSIQEPIIWSMFGPISCVSVATIILFLLAIAKSLPVVTKEMDDLAAAELVRSHILSNTIKTPLIGIHWLLTVYVVNESLIDYVYLYSAFTIAKSIGLFVILCIVDKYIRYNLYVSWLRFKGKQVPFLEDYATTTGVQQHHSQWYAGPQAMMSMPLPTPQVGAGLYGAGKSAGYFYGGTAAAGGQVMTPGFQSSCTDIFRPELLDYSVASTTSRSTATGTSSSVAYREYRMHRVRASNQDHHDDDRLEGEEEGDDDDDEQLEEGGYGRAGRPSGRSGHRRRHKKSHHHSHKKHHHHSHHHGHHHHHHSHKSNTNHHHHHHHHRDRSHSHRTRDDYDDEQMSQTTSQPPVAANQESSSQAAAIAAATSDGYGRHRSRRSSHKHRSHRTPSELQYAAGSQEGSGAASPSRRQAGNSNGGELASSHSSDDDDDGGQSSMKMPKTNNNSSSIYSHDTPQAQQQVAADSLASSATAAESLGRQQTLPMELLAPTTDGGGQQATQSLEKVDQVEDAATLGHNQ